MWHLWVLVPLFHEWEQEITHLLTYFRVWKHTGCVLCFHWDIFQLIDLGGAIKKPMVSLKECSHLLCCFKKISHLRHMKKKSWGWIGFWGKNIGTKVHARHVKHLTDWECATMDLTNPGQGEAPSSSQLPNIGFNGVVFFLMVTSN